jgi:hypothetical protein
MPQTIIDRFHHYHDADARMQFLRRQTPNIKFSLCFAPSSAVGAKSAQ